METYLTLQFKQPDAGLLNDFVTAAENDEIDEDVFDGIDDEAQEYLDSILDDYQGYFYQVESVDIEDSIVKLVYSLDSDGLEFAEDMMQFLHKVGAQELTAEFATEYGQVFRLTIEKGQVKKQKLQEGG